MLHLLAGEHGQGFLHLARGAIFGTFAEEEDVFDVVLDNGTGLVGLAVKASAVAFRFGDAIGDLGPKNGCEAVEIELAHADLDTGMQGHDVVAAFAFARHADIAHDAADAATRNEDAGAFLPDFVEFREEVLVGIDVAHLVDVRFVFLESPIGWGGDDEVDAFVGNEREVAGVAEDEPMVCGVERSGPRRVPVMLVQAEELFKRALLVIGEIVLGDLD